MPDAVPPGVSRAAAVAQLGAWLQGTLGARALTPAAVPERFTHGWELAVAVGESTLRLALLVDKRFPWSKPRVALLDAPPFPSFPHVEEDGLICVLSEVDEADPRNPIGTAKVVLAGAEAVLLEGMSGANAEDFRTEFLSYWDPTATGTAVSLLDPCEPSRTIRVWAGQKYVLVADREADIRNWLANRLAKTAIARPMIGDGLLVWLDQPLLPDRYPRTADEVLALADEAGLGDRLRFLLRAAQENLVVVIGASTVHGACRGGVRLVRSKSRSAKRMKALGMQPGASFKTTFSPVRYSVARADPWWVHGRDSNGDVTSLAAGRVAIVGCGSLGSPLARLLGQAGVGHLDLIDPETMQWANVGRHALGGESVATAKAESLATQLGRNFPHLRFEGHAKPWQDVDGVLAKADLIVGAAGSWAQEGQLNQAHLAGGLPPILYCWIEPHGVAAHAVLLGPRSGCFQCGLGPQGEPTAHVVDFPKQTLRQAPACGAFFQPYGATAAAMAASLAADLVLDALLERADAGTHRVLSARQAQVSAAGGDWSSAWTGRCGAGHEAGRTEEFEWRPQPSCPACGGAGL